MPKPFFFCKHLSICTQKLTEMPRSTKLAKFATVHNIFTTVQKFFSTVSRKIYCANFFFLLCKKVSLSDISASRKISRGGPNTPSIFFFVQSFRHLGELLMPRTELGLLMVPASFCAHTVLT